MSAAEEHLNGADSITAVVRLAERAIELAERDAERRVDALRYNESEGEREARQAMYKAQERALALVTAFDVWSKEQAQKVQRDVQLIVANPMRWLEDNDALPAIEKERGRRG